MIATRSSGGDNEIECKNDCHSGICCFPHVCVHPPCGGAAKPSAGASAIRQPLPAPYPSPSPAEPSAPMPSAAMAAAMPYSGGQDSGVPRYELFLGYSYLRAVPTLAAGNRLVWLNGGSASVAFNVNRYLGMVGDFGAYTNSRDPISRAHIRLQST